MDIWITLLRAVNVGGVNLLPMAEFRAMLEAIGLKGARTYIQSGNAVFRSDLTAPVLSAGIADAVLAHFGFRPPVLVLGQVQFQAALTANPFPKAASEPTHLHAFFMDRAMPEAGLAFLKSVAAPGEQYALRGRVLWLYLPDGIGRSKLARRVMALPVDITARNLRTVQTLADLAQKLSA